MFKFKTLWHVLKHSLFPLDYYYHKVRKTHFSFSFKYFTSFIFIVVVTAALLKSAIFISMYPQDKLRTLLTEIETDYPKELVISINNNGRLSMNLEQPYILFSPIEKNPSPLLVVDPKAQKPKIYEYDSNLLLTERQMIFMIGDNVYEMNFSKGNPLRIDSTDISTIANNAQVILDSYWLFILIVLFTGVVLAPPIIYVATLTMLFVASLVYYFLLKVLFQKKNIEFRKIFQISLHTITAPLAIQCILFVLGIKVSIDLWYLLLVYVFLAGGIYEAYFEKKKK